MSIDLNRRSNWLMIAGLILALAIGAIAGSILTVKSGRVPFSAVETVPVRVSVSSPVSREDVSFASGFSSVVSAVIPAVVNVASSKIARGGRSDPFSDPLRRFFGDQIPRRQRREKDLGSGVIVSPDGYILTNYHVVNGASQIIVSLSDKREFRARVIGADPKTDIAVIKIDASNLPVLTFGDSSKLHVGDFVLAVGSPFGLAQTVTMGIISAKGRVNLGIEDYEDFIQTDTAINPGNSGGALINVQGELIGINTAILSRGSSNQGVGFAIPINMAREVMSQILKNGKVIRAYLGAWIQPVTPEIAEIFHLPEASGVLLGDVEEGSPAAGSGLQRGDIIIALDGVPVQDSQTFRMKVAMSPPGTTVRLKVLHDGSKREVEVKLEELPAGQTVQIPKQNESQNPLEGLGVAELTSDTARNLGLGKNARGVVVTNVTTGCAADNAGVQRGDVIQEINRKPIAGVGDFNRAAAAFEKGPVLLLISRKNKTMYVVVNF